MKKIFIKTTIVVVALAVAACSTTPVRRSMKESWNDTMTAGKIRYKLMRDTEVKKSTMHVEVFRGQVTLTGRAMTDAEKSRAEMLAKSVKRVTGVEDYIHVVGAAPAVPVVAAKGAPKHAGRLAAIQEKTLTGDDTPATIPTVHEGTGTGKTAAPVMARATRSAKADTQLATVQKSTARAKKAVAKAPAKKAAPLVAVKKVAPAPVPAAPAAKVVGQAKTGLPWDGEVYEDDASSMKSATRTPVVTKAPAAVQAQAPTPASDDLAKEAAQELEQLRQKK